MPDEGAAAVRDVIKSAAEQAGPLTCEV